MLLAIFGTALLLGSSPVMAGADAATFTPPDLSNVSATTLREAYAARLELDFLLAPIHSRAELNEYLKVTGDSGSPLDALTPDAQQRFFSSLVFTKGGLGSFSYADLQYLSATKIYKILSLFGVQSVTPMISGAQILNATDSVIMGTPTPAIDYKDFKCSPPATCTPNYYSICIGDNCRAQ